MFVHSHAYVYTHPSACPYLCIFRRAHQDKCAWLCVYVCVSVLGEFGIAQRRLGNAVETAAVFCKTMITSCPASAASPVPPTHTHPSKRAVCRCAPADLCCLPLHGEKCILRCFFSTCKGLPLFHLGLWKIPEPLTAATQHRRCEIEQCLRNSAEDGGRYMWGDYLTVGEHCPLVYFIVLHHFIQLKLWIFIPESVHFAWIYCVLHGDPSCRVAE